MAKVYREFSISDLREWDFPCLDRENERNFPYVVSDEVVDSGRWTEYRDVILYDYHGDGHFYLIEYETGLTEYQEMSFEDRFCSDPVKGLKVYPVERIITKIDWLPLEIEDSD